MLHKIYADYIQTRRCVGKHLRSCFIIRYVLAVNNWLFNLHFFQLSFACVLVYRTVGRDIDPKARSYTASEIANFV